MWPPPNIDDPYLIPPPPGQPPGVGGVFQGWGFVRFFGTYVLASGFADLYTIAIEGSAIV